MFKKYMAVLLALIMCAGVFASCSYEGAPTNLEKPKVEVEDITKYLGEDTSAYFTIAPLNMAKESLADKIEDGTFTSDDDIFAAYVALCGNGSKELPASLVDSYVNAMKTEGKDDEALKAEAKALIKEEMVVYLAFINVDELKNLSFNNAVREAAANDLAEKLGGEYTFTPDLDSKEYYAIDSYIKQQLIVAYLKGESHEYAELCKPATDESGESAESSEESNESTQSTESVESNESVESDESVESAESNESVESDESVESLESNEFEENA